MVLNTRSDFGSNQKHSITARANFAFWFPLIWNIRNYMYNEILIGRNIPHKVCVFYWAEIINDDPIIGKCILLRNWKHDWSQTLYEWSVPVVGFSEILGLFVWKL